jgi:hypothetical protein
VTDLPEATARPTRYTVSCLPERDINTHLYEITVTERGGHNGQIRWAVCWLGRCLDDQGEWDHEPIPSYREDGWLDSHRFDLDTALRLAKEAARHVEVNGHTVADAYARSQARSKENGS